MEPTTIILGTLAIAALCGLAWLGGYKIGQASGEVAGLEKANRRVNGVLDSLNNRKPKTQRGKRKAARKAARV